MMSLSSVCCVKFLWSQLSSVLEGNDGGTWLLLARSRVCLRQGREIQFFQGRDLGGTNTSGREY